MNYKEYILDLAEVLKVSGPEDKIIQFAQTIVMNSFTIEEAKKMEG